MAPKVKSGPMCIVTIWHRDYLLPVSTGLKIVQLMSEAVELDAEYLPGADYIYTVGQPVKVEFCTVRPDQLRMPESAVRKLLRLEHQ